PGAAAPTGAAPRWAARSQAQPKSAPKAAQKTSWVPIEASRNSHSSVPGKPSGTSSTVGSSTQAATTGTRNATTEASHRGHGPAWTRRDVATAIAAAASPTRTITTYRKVRLSMVSGSPTAGGLAGYFRNGTRMTATNAVPTAASTSSPSDRGPTRPRRPANTSAKI